MMIHVSVATRADITHAVNFLSQFNNYPRKQHCIAAERKLQYLKGTQEYGIFLQNTDEPLKTFVDAEWTKDKSDRRSYTCSKISLSARQFGSPEKKKL